MIVEAHGSFATQRCIECKTEFPETMMRRAIQAKEVPRCLRKACNGLVKPDIVFFGEALPEAFHRNRTLPASADLALVIGTSLTVQPFASLPSFVREETPRVLINLERVGGLGSRPDDVLLLGDCDDGVRKLAGSLGWLDELEALWDQTNPSKNDQNNQQQLPAKTRDEKLEEEIGNLTEDIDKTLKLSKDHHNWLQDHLKEKHNPGQTSSAPLENTHSAVWTTPTVAEQANPSQEGATLSGTHRPSCEEEDNAAAIGSAEHRSDQLEAHREDDGGLDHVFPHRAHSMALEKSSL